MAIAQSTEDGLRSFAKGASAGRLDIVPWRWNTGEGDRLSLVDDQGRLSSP